MKILKIVFVITTIMHLNSCTDPFTKEEYMEDYKEFIETVSSEHKSYSEEEWKENDEKYEKYKGEWYYKFKEEFTWKEELIIAKHSIQYTLFRSGEGISSLINTIFENKDELEKTIEFYINNNHKDELESIIKKAEEVSEEAEQFVNDLIEKYNKE